MSQIDVVDWTEYSSLRHILSLGEEIVLEGSLVLCHGLGLEDIFMYSKQTLCISMIISQNGPCTSCSSFYVIEDIVFYVKLWAWEKTVHLIMS